MAKDRELKHMIKRVNSTLDKIDKSLKSGKEEVSVEVEKDRVAYKEGLVDGLCMMSWVKESGITAVGADKIDYVGKDLGDKTTKLEDMLIEIGSVYGFDGKEQLKRVKMAEEVDVANENVEVLDDEVKNDEVKITDIKGKEVGDERNDKNG